MYHSVGNHSVREYLIISEILGKLRFNCESIIFVRVLLIHTRTQYSAVEYTSAQVNVLNAKK